MSLVNKIKKLKKKKYLYPRMIDIINKDSKDVNKYNKTFKKELFEEIMKDMKKFNDNNDISKIIDYDIMNQFFDKIIYFFKKKQELKRMNLLTILKNLLFTKKDNKVVPNLDDSNNENIFTINDFIYNYTLGALKKKLFNKDIKIVNLDELYDLYLYLIFQIEEQNFIIKLKILIYSHLYEKKEVIGFILESSKNILDINNYDKKKLKYLQETHNEIDDISLKKVSDNMISFFKQDRMKLDDWINFFDKVKTKKNLKKKNESILINIEDIVIDSLDYKSNKIYFFSPEFLIVNGLKSNIESCDFEMFNSDNYGVDEFSKFLNLIIPEINKSIKEDNFSNDFIKEKLIQFHKDDLIHFMSAKLDYNSKNELNKSGNNNYKNSDFLKINLISKKKKIKFEKNKNINYKDLKEFNDESSEVNDHLDISNSSQSKTSYDEFKKKSADYFEDLINKKLIKKAEKDKLISLPNILFVLNLKKPEYNGTTNSINFKSVHLDFFNEENNEINENYYYGWKEIDAIFLNNSVNVIEFNENDYFYTNLTYVKEKSESNKLTCFQMVKENKFKVYPNSIVFCEIKNSFQSIAKGTEDVFEVKVRSENKKKINNSKSYNNQLPKLIKKFKYFFKVFQDNKKEYEEVNTIHLIYLYDTFNIENNNQDSNFELIKDVTEEILSEYNRRFDNSIKIIFQLVFFDLFTFNKDMTKKLEEKDKKLEEKDKKLKEKDKKLEEKDKKLEEKDEIIKKKDFEIDLIKNILADGNLNEVEKNKKISDLINSQI